MKKYCPGFQGILFANWPHHQGIEYNKECPKRGHKGVSFGVEPQHQVWSVQPGGNEILASRYVAKYVLASEDDN